MGRENQGILGGLSPEEILAKKEIQGGVIYDDPFILDLPEESAETISEITHQEKNLNPIQEQRVVQEEPEILTSLGKAETFIPPQSPPATNPGLEIGWKNIPLGILPSRGDYYPEGTRIAIRPAETREIRHFSSIDEEDKIDVDEKLNYILDKCSVISFPGGRVVSYKDYKDEDRFFLVMAIRDLTFVQGENRIILTPETSCKDKKSCPINGGIELRTGVLSSYEIDPRLMKYYSSTNRNFIFPIKKLGKEITMWVPSIGVRQAVYEFLVNCVQRGIEVDDSFSKIAPFLFPDWRGLDEGTILRKMNESNSWSKEEFSLYLGLSEMIKIGTNLDVNIKCPTCGAEVTAPIMFPGGFRSLFVISDLFGELL